MVAYYVPVIYLSLLENEKSPKILQSSDSSIFSGLCIYHFSALWNPHFLHILRMRSLVVSDLRSETKGSRFESAASYVQRWALCSNCVANV